MLECLRGGNFKKRLGVTTGPGATMEELVVILDSSEEKTNQRLVKNNS